MMGAPAVLVIASAPRAGAVKRALEPLLGPAGCAALQAVLIRRAAAWAVQVAPGTAFFAVAGGANADEVRALLPRGVRAFAADGATEDERLADAVARIGRGPLLVAGSDCPRLGPAHAAAALGDLAAGCDAVFGATLEGGWYLAGLREPRAELLSAAAPTSGFGAVLQRAAELGAEVGLLRHERLLLTPADAAAFLADPILPRDVRAALASAA